MISDLNKLGKNKRSGFAYNFMNFQYSKPTAVLDRMGAGGKAIKEWFIKGETKQAELFTEVERFAKKTFTSGQVQKWRNDVRRIALSNGETIAQLHTRSAHIKFTGNNIIHHIYLTLRNSFSANPAL